MKKENFDFQLQYEILHRLEKSPDSVKGLTNKLGRRTELISRQLGFLLKNKIVIYEDKYDDFYGRRVHFYHITDLGKMTLQTVDNNRIDTSDIYAVASNTDSEIIKKLASQSIEKFETSQDSWNGNEPLSFCKLGTTFNDQPIIAGLQRMNIELEEIDENGGSSGERLEKILDKKCDLAIIPKVTLTEYFKEKKNLSDVVLLAAMNGSTPTKRVENMDENSKDVYYSGGHGTKKLARLASKNPVELDHNDLLKAIKDKDVNNFATYDQDILPILFEGNYKISDTYKDENFLVTNTDSINNLSQFHKKIFFQTDNVFRYMRSKNLLLKQVIPYVSSDLYGYVRKNKKIFRRLNQRLESEMSG